MPSAFPGIAEEEKITISSSCNLIWRWEPLAILERAASGSPWEPVQSKHTSLDGSRFASSGVTNISLCFI